MLLAFLSFRNFKNDHHHRSFYAGIRRLPPAHYLLLQNGALKVERYWHFDLNRQIRFKNSEEYASAFREIFQEAVKCRIRSKNPVTALLSGGLDSSAIVTAAAQSRGENPNSSELHALNFYSDDPKTDERAYAAEVAKKANIPLHMLFCRTNDFETGMNEFLAQVEAPIINTSRNLEPYQFLKDRDWRVVLSGDGGDQIMDEFGFGADLLAHFRFSEFFKNTRLFSKDFDDRPIDVMKQSLMRLIPESWLWLSRRLRGNVPPVWINAATVKELGFTKLLHERDSRPEFQSFCQAANYDEAVRPYAVMKLEIDRLKHSAWTGGKTMLLDSGQVEKFKNKYRSMSFED
jgi:asparagine synthase (glutamine-hydrolysing)